ncbi:hypothetical protein AQUCO_00600008v1 [Aquilegia coerulea]|uniref:Uncharacterized protein n=1 Tax=Aquilegia coerulea TaxID=218851 RepID=A0A2G5EML8_AQUCA|nr:hypothetical protein AQUCO_00600008v1 [Aquilegia coerulea]
MKISVCNHLCGSEKLCFCYGKGMESRKIITSSTTTTNLTWPNKQQDLCSALLDKVSLTFNGVNEDDGGLLEGAFYSLQKLQESLLGLRRSKRCYNLLALVDGMDNSSYKETRVYDDEENESINGDLHPQGDRNTILFI